MTQEELYQQYLDEVSLFERYGSKNVITFDEWISFFHADE